MWTDYRGHAVIPGLPAYTTSHLEVQTQSLPKRVDLKNGTKILAVGRGSFNTVDFQVVNVRRVLLEVRDEQGAPLPQGSAVFGPDNTYLTNVVGEGLIFLNHMDDGQILSVSPPGSARACLLHLNLESQSTEDKLYETASAICRAQ